MKDNSHRAMVAISVETVLMRNGGPEYQLVLARLENQYACKIFDCYDHPEYLRNVLTEVYGEQYGKIIEKIEQELGESADDTEIVDFLKVLKKTQ